MLVYVAHYKAIAYDEVQYILKEMAALVSFSETQRPQWCLTTQSHCMNSSC